MNFDGSHDFGAFTAVDLIVNKEMSVMMNMIVTRVMNHARPTGWNIWSLTGEYFFHKQGRATLTY